MIKGGFAMKNRNNIIVICSVIVGICAAIATTLVILQRFKKKKSQLESTSFMFENDFDADNECTCEDCDE